MIRVSYYEFQRSIRQKGAIRQARIKVAHVCGTSYCTSIILILLSLQSILHYKLEIQASSTVNVLTCTKETFVQFQPRNQYNLAKNFVTIQAFLCSAPESASMIPIINLAFNKIKHLRAFIAPIQFNPTQSSSSSWQKGSQIM